MDYQKLNDAMRKDHYHVPFIDQMLDGLVGHGSSGFFYGYFRYNEILLHYDTYAFKCIGLFNIQTTLQMCMMTIFHDNIEVYVVVFMDDFCVIGKSFEVCL